MNQFVLPEIWYVRVTEENQEVLSKWRQICPVYTGNIVGMCKLINENCIKKGHTASGRTKGKTYDFGEEITFEQFKQEILGMKKIIEYRAKTEYYSFSKCLCEAFPPSTTGGWERMDADSTLVDHYKKAGVFDLWFYPVYEEEFKIGDWIVVQDQWNYNDRNEILGKIEIWDKNNRWIRVHNGTREFETLYINEAKEIRKATAEEIELAQSKTFKVGNFEVIVRSGRALHKQDDITRFVKELIKNNPRATEKQNLTHGGYEAVYQDVIFSRTGCQHSESKLSEWLQVYNAL